MKLIPISEHPDSAKILYDLLAERTPEQSISHKWMPTWEEHLEFIAWMAPIPAPAGFGEDTTFLDPRVGEQRYGRWYLIEKDGAIVGSIYLTCARNEIGVSIFKEHQRKGLGTEAVRLLVQRITPAKYLANINPANEASRKMFEKLGFKTVQHTLALEAE